MKGRKEKYIYILAVNDSQKAYKSLRSLVKHYPIIPYYTIYRALKTNNNTSINEYTITKTELK